MLNLDDDIYNAIEQAAYLIEQDESYFSVTEFALSHGIQTLIEFDERIAEL